jgi:hypothetical protein
VKLKTRIKRLAAAVGLCRRRHHQPRMIEIFSRQTLLAEASILSGGVERRSSKPLLIPEVKSLPRGMTMRL